MDFLEAVRSAIAEKDRDLLERAVAAVKSEALAQITAAEDEDPVQSVQRQTGLSGDDLVLHLLNRLGEGAGPEAPAAEGKEAPPNDDGLGALMDADQEVLATGSDDPAAAQALLAELQKQAGQQPDHDALQTFLAESQQARSDDGMDVVAIYEEEGKDDAGYPVTAPGSSAGGNSSARVLHRGEGARLRELSIETEGVGIVVTFYRQGAMHGLAVFKTVSREGGESEHNGVKS